MKTSKIIGFAVILSVFLLSSNALSEENSSVIYVDDDGTADYTSIQDAIDNASDGDTIFVYNGVYNEIITINKTISLIGENKEKTIILGGNNTKIIDREVMPLYYLNNPNNSTFLVNISADNVTIAGFTIKNSTKYCFDINLFNFYYSWRPPIPQDIYEKTHVPIGIGINISSNNSKIMNNIFENNAYAIDLKNNQNTLISNNTIQNNVFCGLSIINSSSNCIINNAFSNNSIGIDFINYSSYNRIYHNNFINSTSGHVFDLLIDSNVFYNESIKQGNYWDDYNGTDKNNDGIGDNPYNISSNAEDMYPFMNPYYGKIVITDFYVDEGSVQLMLLVGMVVTIIFCIPIGLWWRKKYFK